MVVTTVGQIYGKYGYEFGLVGRYYTCNHI